MPFDIQTQIREMVKEAILEYLLKKYISDLTECAGGIPDIISGISGKPQVRIIAIKKGI